MAGATGRQLRRAKLGAASRNHFKLSASITGMAVGFGWDRLLSAKGLGEGRGAFEGVKNF